MRNALLNPATCFFGLVLLLLVGVAIAQIVDTEPGLTWQRPDADFSKYSKIHIKPLDLSDVKVLKPAWEQDDLTEWTFAPRATETIKDMYMEIMSNELSKNGGFALVAEDGEGVLQLELEFLSITPYVKPGASDADGHVIQTLGSGDVVVSAELRDSRTGTLLFLVEGERKIGTTYREIGPESHVANVEETFAAWGQRL
ncbi:MAG: DUF3313 family protein, partial [Thermoanaerobaculales bacterium]|nr:DUF3313 family protein [Thermoanaerobaculales bacterium]